MHHAFVPVQGTPMLTLVLRIQWIVCAMLCLSIGAKLLLPQRDAGVAVHAATLLECAAVHLAVTGRVRIAGGCFVAIGIGAMSWLLFGSGSCGCFGRALEVGRKVHWVLAAIMIAVGAEMVARCNGHTAHLRARATGDYASPSRVAAGR